MGRSQNEPCSWSLAGREGPEEGGDEKETSMIRGLRSVMRGKDPAVFHSDQYSSRWDAFHRGAAYSKHRLS